jgi:MFS family permease
MYQVVWVRLLGLSFGVTSYAVATVLCSFMAGLALGSLLAGRWADRLRRPLVAYALAEIAIGAIGVASPAIFRLVQATYVETVQATGLSALLPLSLLRFALAFTALIVPTTLMGRPAADGPLGAGAADGDEPGASACYSGTRSAR